METEMSIATTENFPTLLLQELEQRGISCQGLTPGEIQRHYQLLLSNQITGRCHICNGNEFWETPDGKLLCARYHPKPK